MTPSQLRQAREDEIDVVRLPRQLRRVGSRLFLVDGDKSTEITINQPQDLMLDISDILHAARHWKERGE